jgi:hypothetical protein
MRIVDKYILVIAANLVFASCITTQQVPIDQLEPGKVTLPASIRKVALISRNFKFSIDTLTGYSNINFRLKKGTREDNRAVDSVAVTNSLDHLRKALLESGRFDEVFVYPFNAIKPHNAVKELPLSSGYIKSLCLESETDAVISLEMISSFYTRHNGSAGREIQAGANVKIVAIWSLYTPQSDDPVDRYTHSEVIRWKDFDPELNKKYKLPGRKEAVAMACGTAAMNYSRRVVPSWVESFRTLIGLNDPDFDKALSYAGHNKWKEAAMCWERYLGSRKPKVAGVAALNFAIAQEMLGETEKAAFWSEKSVKLLKNGEPGRIARAYAATLYERKIKSGKLNTLLKVNPG